MITKSRLDEVLSYEKETGEFTWIKSKGTKIKGSIAGSVTKEGYLAIAIDGSKYLSHRLAFLTNYGSLPVYEIDHINGDKSDNRIINLREATNSLNQQNKIKARKDNKTSLIGVGFHSASNKYRARITLNRKQIHLGLFDNEQEAFQAYVLAKRNLHQFCTI